MNKTEYYYLVREYNQDKLVSEQIFKAESLIIARQNTMKDYKNKLLSKINRSNIERNTAFPVSVYLVENINGECNYYPIIGKQAHEMEKGWQIESRIMQELNPMNAFFEKV